MKDKAPKVRLGKLSEFRPQSSNSNLHTERGLRMLDDAMSEDGYVAPMTAVADNEVIDGSARLERAFDKFNDEAIILEHDGRRPIVTVRTDIPNAKTKEAQRIAIRANRIAEVDLSWDPEILQSLDTKALDGMFSDKELAEILSEIQTEPKDAEPQIDKAAELQQKWGVNYGDLWTIGNHRLLVGDATNKADVGRVCANVQPSLMVTDPPYGVDLDTSWREDAGISAMGPQSAKGLQWDSNADWSGAMVIAPVDVVYVWHADRFIITVAEVLKQAGFDIKQQIIWNKSVAPFGRAHYHWKHEPCWYAVRKGKTARWIAGADQVTVWDDASPRHIMGGSTEAKVPHPTQKPVGIFEHAIRNHSGDVYDPFVGSGTTLVAAENLNRKCYAIEISPAYSAVCLERMHTAFPSLKIERLDKAEAA